MTVHIEATLRRLLLGVGAVTALVGFASAVGAGLGFRFTGPGRQLALQAQTDTVIMRQVRQINDTLQAHDRDQTAFRDSMSQAVAKGFRPLNIFICLNASPKDSALMDLDCDSIIGRARNGAIMRANDRAFEGQQWKARPVP